MYVENITASRALTAELAEAVADSASGCTARVTISCHGRSVHLPVLPWVWAELDIHPGDTITVTSGNDRRPTHPEDRRALGAVVTALRGNRTQEMDPTAGDKATAP
ncbi:MULTISPECIES: hypothetical protein [unclassified Nocardia]|uniref:hypothetical protein n=1 Tax=unclassified Nocardia TaxID=2637762 RepID=UPI0024A9B532|nr:MULTISPECIES: hypothetical protein [unclassified Nocardia]